MTEQNPSTEKEKVTKATRKKREPISLEPEVNEVETHDDVVIVQLSHGLRGAGDTIITEIQVREPTGGELAKVDRRLDLIMMDVSAHKKIIPLITIPSISPKVLDNMPPRDSQKIINAVIGFLGD